MSEPIISVIIPTYNSDKFITKTLECLKIQTFKDFEVVIINDGSVDETQVVISQYITSHPDLKIRLFNQEKKGIAEARNKGILEAKGRYISFLDSDDIWYPEKLSRCYEILERFPNIDLVCHNEAMRSSSGKIIRNLHYGPYIPEMFRRLLFQGNCLSTSATVVRRNALLAIGLFREYSDFFSVEDYDLWLRLSKKYKFYFIKDILGEYIMRDNSATLGSPEEHYNNQIKVIKLNFKEYKKRKTLDYVLINFRISQVYLIIFKYFFYKKDVKQSAKYFLKGLLQLFNYAFL